MDSEETHRSWADRSGEYSPAYYAEIGANEVTDTIATALSYYTHEDAAILEVGCSSGRHLARLREEGFENLTGIDINDESFEVMADHFPALADTGTFHTGAVEDVVPEFEDDAFDVVYSVETLQHIPPENEWVFADLARITNDLLVTAENEGNGPQRGRDEGVNYVHGEFPLYYREWKRVFTDLGFAQVLSEPTNRDTIRVFRTP